MSRPQQTQQVNFVDLAELISNNSYNAMARKRKDPKVGTGKKPKGSGRRLYTDENPKDTVSIKFATPADARATVAKVKELKNLCS